jgi:hypothetical protein
LAIAARLVILDPANELWQQDLVEFNRQLEHLKS